jgi:DNA-binding transcriptional LysR family regulator
MVERGVGVALLPRIMAEAAVSSRLRTVEVARGAVRRQVALVHRGEAYLTAAARALRTTLVEVLARRKARSPA